MTHSDVSDDATTSASLSSAQGSVAWAMVEASPDGMLLTDEDGVVAVLNAQIIELFGYDRSDILGNTIEMLIPERHRQSHAAHRTLFRASPRRRPMGSDIELMGRHRDGTEFPVEVSLSPVATDSGLQIVATVRDVTKRVNAEAHSHAVVELIEEAHDGVFMFEPSTLMFTYVNHGAAIQLGYTQHELMLMSPLHIKPEFTEASFKQLLAPLLADAVGSLTFTTVHRRKDGSDVPVEIIVDYPPASGPGRARRLIALVRDITDRIQIEEAVRQSEASLQLFDDRERLARDLHDLIIQRLFAAGMGLQSIQASISDPVAERRVIDTIAELDSTIAELRTAIFGLNTTTSHDAAAALRSVIEHAKEQLGFAPLLTIEGNPETVTTVVCEQLVAVLTEALANVVRHAHATHATVTLSITDATTELTVTDNGVGIDPDALPGSGLENLGNRANDHDGTFTINTASVGTGTTLVWTALRI